LRLAGATLGAEGVVVLAGNRVVYRPAFEVACRDTTGAGDVFHGAFAFALLQGWKLERALDFSCAMAGLKCTAVGARGRIATREEAEALVATARRRAPRWRELPRTAGVAR
jgi:sugar/nucleoside kinase (ribokinase family)